MSATTPCRLVLTAVRRAEQSCTHGCCTCAQLAEVEVSVGKQPVHVLGTVGSSGVGHPASLVADGIRSTKWLTMNGPPWILRFTLAVPLGTPLAGYKYTFLTADDLPAHDPTAWRLECQHEERGAFVLVDEQDGVVPPTARMAPYPSFVIPPTRSQQKKPISVRPSFSPPQAPQLGQLLLPRTSILQGTSPPSPSPPPPWPEHTEEALRLAGKTAATALSKVEHDFAAHEMGSTTALLLISCSVLAAMLAATLLYCVLRRAFAVELHRLRGELARVRSRAGSSMAAASRCNTKRVCRSCSSVEAEEAPLVAEREGESAAPIFPRCGSGYDAGDEGVAVAQVLAVKKAGSDAITDGGAPSREAV